MLKVSRQQEDVHLKKTKTHLLDLKIIIFI